MLALHEQREGGGVEWRGLRGSHWLPRPLSAATVEHAQSQSQPQHAPFAVDRRCRAHSVAGGGGQVAAWTGLVLAWLGPAVCKRSIMSRAVTFILNLIYIFLLPLLTLPTTLSVSLPRCFPSLLFGLCFWAGCSNSMAIVACRRRLCCCCCRCAAAGDLSAASKACNSFCLLPFASCLLIELQYAKRACWLLCWTCNRWVANRRRWRGY